MKVIDLLLLFNKCCYIRSSEHWIWLGQIQLKLTAGFFFFAASVSMVLSFWKYFDRALPYFINFLTSGSGVC